MTDKKNPSGIAAAGVAGVVIGAGLTAAATALADRKNRKKVYHTIRNFQKQASDAITNFQGEMKDEKKKVDDIVQEVKKEFPNDIKEPEVKTDEKVLKSL